MRRSMCFSLSLLLCSSISSASAAENLGRGLVARPAEEGGVYLSWRLLPGDPRASPFMSTATTAAASRQTAHPRADLEHHRLPGPRSTHRQAGLHDHARRQWPARAKPPRSRSSDQPPPSPPGPLQTIRLQGDYTVQKVGIADLDGDGRLDFVIKQPNDNVDPYVNYWKPSPGTYKLEAYLADGTFLWRHDLGWAIERGIWYSPYVVYDLDGDGQAEVALKTGAEATRATPTAACSTGPSTCRSSTAARASRSPGIDWPDRQPFLDANPEPLRGYNYASRNQLAVAYLDGKTPTWSSSEAPTT